MHLHAYDHACAHADLEKAEQRRAEHSDRTDIAFSVGQVLRHKKYGFRAVVCSWDRRPTVDVRQWDGVVGLSRADRQPFYYCLPDQDDCVAAFGAARDMRYVAEDNLEPVSSVEQAVNHPSIPRVFLGLDVEGQPGGFIPDATLRYEYPQDQGGSELVLSSATADAAASVRGTMTNVVRDLQQAADGVDLRQILGPQAARFLRGPCSDDADAAEMLRRTRDLYELVATMREQRAMHLDRTAVEFGVGQVVRHATEKYRACVMGWERLGSEQPVHLERPKRCLSALSLDSRIDFLRRRLCSTVENSNNNDDSNNSSNNCNNRNSCNNR